MKISSNIIQITIRNNPDITLACHKGRLMATQLGFYKDDQTVIMIVISELATNLIKYTGGGLIQLQVIQQAKQFGISITSHDNGPGIVNLSQVLQDGYSTSDSLGLGLPSVQRLMDEFDIQSEINHGTVITAKKWIK